MHDDPTETFRHDQEEAASRDQQAWDANMATIQADQAMKASHTTHTEARAAFWNALARLLSALAFAAWAAALLATFWALFIWDLSQ